MQRKKIKKTLCFIAEKKKVNEKQGDLQRDSNLQSPSS